MEILIFFSIIALVIGLAIYFIYKSGIITDTIKLVEKGVEKSVEVTKETVDDIDIKTKTRDWYSLIKEKIEEKYQRIVKKKTYSNASVSKESKRKESSDYYVTGITYVNKSIHKSIPHNKITPDELDYVWNSIVSRRSVGCFSCRSADMYQMGGTGHYDFMNLQCLNCGQKAKIKITSNSKAGIECINLGKV